MRIPRKFGAVRVLHADGSTEIMAPPEVGETRSGMRRFVLDRLDDVSGISGTGVVAEGVVFTDGHAVLRWVVGLRSTAIYDSVDDLMQIHGHEGKTQLRWIDG